MRWADLEGQQPRLAELGRKKLADPGVVLVGTVRKDGSPRISPVEPFFWEGSSGCRWDSTPSRRET